jgi:hypothetical protein
MINKLNLALFFFVIGAQAAFGSSGKEGGGGDTCQDRVEAIRNDISDWIEAGGAAGLKLPVGVTLDAYKQKMLKEIELTRADAQHSIVCKKNPKDVVVGTSEKICASSSPQKPKIACYREGFMHLSEDNQYFMVHHEFAFLSGFEDQMGARSDYPLSDQITGYLQEETVKKLAVKPVGNGSIAVMPVNLSQQQSIANNYNNTYFYPAYTSKQIGSLGPVVEKSGVVDEANGFTFVDLAADVDPAKGVGQENPGIVYFNVTASNEKFDRSVAIGIYTSNNELIPIASYNQTMCGNGDGGNCILPMAHGGTFGNYFYGLKYEAGQTTTIGIDIQSICRSFRADSADIPYFCTTHLMGSSEESAGGRALTSGTDLTLNFAIFDQADLGNLGSNNFLPNDVKSDGALQINLNFVTLAEIPTPTRTALCNLSVGWVANPLDSSIDIDGSLFGISSGFTGVGAIIAVANLGTTVNDQATNYLKGNSVPPGYFLPGYHFDFGGFQNSTPTQAYNYKIGFLVRDYAGYVFDDGSGSETGACTFPGEYATSQIQGYLNPKSN